MALWGQSYSRYMRFRNNLVLARRWAIPFRIILFVIITTVTGDYDIQKAKDE